MKVSPFALVLFILGLVMMILPDLRVAGLITMALAISYPVVMAAIAVFTGTKKL